MEIRRKSAHGPGGARRPDGPGEPSTVSCLMNLGVAREKLGSRYDSDAHPSDMFTRAAVAPMWGSMQVPDHVGALLDATSAARTFDGCAQASGASSSSKRACSSTSCNRRSAMRISMSSAEALLGSNLTDGMTCGATRLARRSVEGGA